MKLRKQRNEMKCSIILHRLLENFLIVRERFSEKLKHSEIYWSVEGANAILECNSGMFVFLNTSLFSGISRYGCFSSVLSKVKICFEPEGKFSSETKFNCVLLIKRPTTASQSGVFYLYRFTKGRSRTNKQTNKFNWLSCYRLGQNVNLLSREIRDTLNWNTSKILERKTIYWHDKDSPYWHQIHDKFVAEHYRSAWESLREKLTYSGSKN